MSCSGYGTAEFRVNGTAYTLRGNVTLTTGSYFDGVNYYENTEVENHSASNPVTITRKPVSPKAEFTIADDGDGSALLQLTAAGCNANITFTIGNNVFTFTNAAILGRASINSENGEVSGLSVTGGTFRQN